MKCMNCTRYAQIKNLFTAKRVTVVKYDNGGALYMLRSYDTTVVAVDISLDGTPFVKKLWGGYSATTLRHVNELLMQHDFPKLSARVWCTMEVGQFYHEDEIPALALCLM